MDGWFPLATPPPRSVAIMDPLTGNTGMAALRHPDDKRIEVYLCIAPGHSIILRTFENQGAKAPEFRFLRTADGGVELSGPWKVEFIGGGPASPKAYQAARLESWTNHGDADAQRFAGTAVYRTVFDLPGKRDDSKPVCLDLGRVCNTARIRLNGRALGTLIMSPYRILLDRLKPAGNLLEVEVTNLSANRIRDLDRRKVAWRTFNEINFVSITYKPFDASHWPVFDSGLLGPVRLLPLAEKE